MKRLGMHKRPSPDPIDAHVGSRVRICRAHRDLSQADLGEAIGLTFQQIQKYERGTNRISASRLYEIAQVLDVPVSFFFDDMPGTIEQKPPAEAPADPLTRREALEVVRAYHAIADKSVRKSLFDMIKAVIKSDEV